MTGSSFSMSKSNSVSLNVMCLIGLSMIFGCYSDHGLLKTRPDFLHFRRLAFAYTEIIYSDNNYCY